MIVYAGSARSQFVHSAVLIVTSLTRSVSFLRQFSIEFVGRGLGPAAKSAVFPLTVMSNRLKKTKKGLLQHFATDSFLSDSIQPFAVFVGGGMDFLHGNPSDLRQLFRHPVQVAGMVAFPPEGFGGHKGAIRFQNDSV